MDAIAKVRAEIERLIELNKTKNGFPASFPCECRIEAYEVLLSVLDTIEKEEDEAGREMTAKEETIKAVLKKRAGIVLKVIQHCTDEKSKSFYEGKLDGYNQAIDLIGDSIESIAIEL